MAERASTHPRTIVVGVDSSGASDAALNWARQYADRGDHIVAVRAWDVPFFVSAWVPEAIFPSDFEAMASTALAASLEGVDDDRVQPALRRGRPGPAIVDEAADADLTVVGHVGEGRVSMMLGSTANHVLHHSQGPVAVVRGKPSRSFDHVIVGVDGPVNGDHDSSVDASVRALRWAFQLRNVRRITVVHAWFLPPIETGMFANVPLAMDEWDSAAAAAVDKAIVAAGAPPPDLEVCREVIRAPAASALVKLSHDADLVVVGSRGRGGFAGLLLGSTSAEVAAHSHSPVVVVR